MPEFELILPAYNESKNLKMLIERAVLAAQSRGMSASGFQLVIVNNGSTDDSSKVLSEIKNSVLGEWFRIVDVVKNQGYGFGVYSGLLSTIAPIIGWSHADMQCDPADALDGYVKVKSSSAAMIVKGVRFGRNFRDIFVSRVFELFTFFILGYRIYEINAQPKVFPRKLLLDLRNPPKTFAFDLYVLYKAKQAGLKFETIKVKFPPRIHGVSNWASNFFSRYKTILGIIAYMWKLRWEKTDADHPTSNQ